MSTQVTSKWRVEGEVSIVEGRGRGKHGEGVVSIVAGVEVSIVEGRGRGKHVAGVVSIVAGVEVSIG